MLKFNCLPTHLNTERSAKIPLNSAQLRIWRKECQQSNAAYNMPRGFLLEGQLNLEKLNRALRNIIVKHPLLSAYMPELRNPWLFQIQHPYWTLPVVDLTQVQNPLAIVYERFSQEESVAFQLNRWPLFRIVLFKLDQKSHVLLFNFHALIFDMASWQVLLDDLKNEYIDISSNGSSAQSVVNIPVEDKKTNQLFWNELFSNLNYVAWKNKSALKFPWTFGGAELKLQLDEQHSITLKSLAKHKKMTFSMLLLAIFAYTLFDYVEADVLAIGIPISARNNKDLQSSIGWFAYTIVIFIQKNSNKEQFIDQVRMAFLKALAHQDPVVEDLLAFHENKSGYLRRPLPQFGYNFYEEIAATDLVLENIQVKRIHSPTLTTKQDLNLSVRTNSENKLELRFEYSIDLFNEQEIVDFSRNYLAKGLEFVNAFLRAPLEISFKN